MPRSWGVSTCSTVWCMRCRPSERTVALWRPVLPSGLRTRVILIFRGASLAGAPSGALVSGLSVILLPIPEGRNFFDVFAAAARFQLRALELLQSFDGGIDHIPNLGAAHRLGQD